MIDHSFIETFRIYYIIYTEILKQFGPKKPAQINEIKGQYFNKVDQTIIVGGSNVIFLYLLDKR